jgi:outer membrane immunogenic protein
VSVQDRVFDERLFDFNAGNDGFFGTVIVGWDWQISPRWVFGVFADYDFLDQSNNHRAFGDFFQQSIDVNNVWAIGARLGWLSSASTLWYVTGGYTQLDIEHHPRFADFSGPGFRTSSDSQIDGYFVGVGVDTRLAASNWFLRLEYRFSDFDTASARIKDDFGDVDFRINADAQSHSARLTLTYKFLGGYGWGLGR